LVTVQNAAAAATPSAPDWPRAIDQLIEQIIRYDVANAALHRAVFSQASGDGLRLLHETDEKVIELFTGAISAAVAAGAATVSDPPTTAALLYYAVDGVLNTAYMADTEPDANAIIAAAQEMAHRTLQTTRRTD
jgi:AcrR family transcriptional regulator